MQLHCKNIACNMNPQETMTVQKFCDMELSQIVSIRSGSLLSTNYAEVTTIPGNRHEKLERKTNQIIKSQRWGIHLDTFEGRVEKI